MNAQDVRHVGVVGCGLMGSGIVEVCARAGLRVTFAEGSAELIEAGRARVVRSLDGAVAKGKLDDAARDAALGRIDAVDDVAGLAPVDLVIEAATEDPDAKRAIFGRLGEATRQEVVLASNTSSIPIATLGEASARAERVIGMHFFNPVPVMGLIELTPSAATSDDTFALVRGVRHGGARQDLRPVVRRGRVHREPLADPVPVRRDAAVRAWRSRPARTSTPRSSSGSRTRWGRCVCPT